MANLEYTIQIKVNGTWTSLSGVVRPFSYTQVQDETLDSGVIHLGGSSYSDAIPPYTLCRIFVKLDDSTTQGLFDCVITNSKRVKRVFSGTTLYDWQLDVVEVTKVLERRVYDSMTFTNYLSKDFTSTTHKVTPTVTTDDDTTAVIEPITALAIYSPKIYSSTLDLPKPSDKFHVSSAYASYATFSSGKLKVTTPSGTLTNYGNYAQTITLSEEGVYKIEYYIEYQQLAVGGQIKYDDFTYEVAVASNVDRKAEWTICETSTTGMTYQGIWTSGTAYAQYDDVDYQGYRYWATSSITSTTPPPSDPLHWKLVGTNGVIERLLLAGETRREDTNRTDPIDISINTATTRELGSIKAPELFITRSTAYDALSQVGGVIHGIPRLSISDGGSSFSLSYDILGGSDTYSFPSAAQMNYEEIGYNSDEYAEALDSTVENIVNTVDPTKGAMVEPSFDGYTDARVERGEVKICADDIKILTTQPIYRINKLEVSVTHNGSIVASGDITPYVFENAEYQILSNYDTAVYPYSKAYALCYTQGSRDISGLGFIASGTTSLGTAFNNRTIYNIIKEALGYSMPTGVTPDYINLAFRVTYTAMPTMRVKQKKPYTGWANKNTLIYNQDGNTVEASAYGEKLKGAITRLGNKYIVRTYTFCVADFDSISDMMSQLPTLGKKVTIDGTEAYITQINGLYDQLSIKYTIWFTPNFNRLSEYVGINSNYRLYDVSEKQSIERLSNYGEVCYVGNAVSGTFHPFILDAEQRTVDTINQDTPTFTSTSPSCAFLMWDSNLTTLLLRPLSKLAIGNSVALSFSMEDNYGVGYQSLYETEIDNPSSAANTKVRVQRLLNYGDNYGELTKLHVAYYRYMANNSWTASDQINGGMGAVYPQMKTSSLTRLSGKISEGSFVIKKDSREKLNFTYQMHYVSNDQSVVIGSALTQNNGLLNNTYDSTKSAKYYLLTKPLNVLNDTVDLTGAKEGSRTSGTNFVGITHPGGTDTYVAWACVDPTTHKLYVGKNVTLSAGSPTSYIYFTMTDNSYGG